MKRFISKFILYCTIIICICTCLIIVYNYIYETPTTSRNKIFLGDSTSKASINPKIATQYENFSQGGEAYLFSYFKLKRLIEIQKADTVFINLSPSNLINNEYESVGTSGRERYLPLIDSKGHWDLFKANPYIYLKSWITISKETIYLFSNQFKISFGGYSANNSVYKENYYDSKEETIIPHYQTKYLQKIVDICKSKNVYLVFINLPKYTKDKDYNKYNRKEFLDFYYQNYSEIDYLDFSNLNMSKLEKIRRDEKDYFADMVHNSEKGAKVFSYFLKNHKLSDLLKSNYNKKKK